MRLRENAALLSIDEIMLSLFGQHCGDKHDEYSEKAQTYLFHKSLELIEVGVDVILDWGFWSKEKRNFARKFYSSRNIACEIHYIDVSDETWAARLEKRNHAVLKGEVNAYYVDKNLAAKVIPHFDVPSKDEIDVWVEQ